MYYGPRTITNGLILALDAADRNSYPRSGTTWNNLASTAITTTIYGSPTFVNQNGGYFDFDGVDNAMLTSTTLPEAGGLYADTSTRWSASCWFRFPTNPVDRGGPNANVGNAILGMAGGVATGATFVFYVGSISNDGYNGSIANALMFVMRGAATRVSPGLVNDNTWHNTAVSWNGSTAALYFDGVYIGDALNNIGAGNQGYLLTIGNNANNTAGYQMYQGGINSVFIYSIPLTASQVLQNYNALKSRYGR